MKNAIASLMNMKEENNLGKLLSKQLDKQDN